MQRKTREQLSQDDLADYMAEPGDYPDRTATVSATECTGLFPAPPKDDAEYHSLQEMHGMGIPNMQKPDDAEG